MTEYVTRLTRIIGNVTTIQTVDGNIRVSAELSNGIDLPMLDMKINDEIYTKVKYDIDVVNQVIRDYLMANIGDDVMSNTSYVENGGEICPMCESTEVTC